MAESNGTSFKRKRIYDDTETALEEANAKKEKKKWPEINFDERKLQLQKTPNQPELIFVLMNKIVDAFVDLSTDLRNNEHETGPSMLWEILPPLLRAIESTRPS